MIESLRAVGYSLPSAIADIVDNSISAAAKNVHLQFEWDGAKSFISVVDDGTGMTEPELLAAMTLGSKSPLEMRDPRDLGRFGLGLKTASFSQARRLIVKSRCAHGGWSTRIWDLDYVAEWSEWRLLKEAAADEVEYLKQFESMVHGTIVMWSKIDRVVDKDRSLNDQRAHRRFLEVIDDVEHHISMVFHRFLERRNKLLIDINGVPVEPWDPFLRHELATQSLPEESLQQGEVKVFPYVLPHHSKISEATFRKAQGPHGWNAQQGFYIYRNERLLVPGHWLGFGFQKEEHYKLARIQVDIPTSSDLAWAIDVKKSRARPPASVREDLKRIARLTRDTASNIYRNRGKIVARSVSEDFVFTWLHSVLHGKISYQINREHPLVKATLKCSKEQRNNILALLKLIEETLPKEQIWLDNQESVESRTDPFESVDKQELVSVLSPIFEFLKSQELAVDDIRKHLLAMEPFNRFPNIVNSFCNSQRGA
jgi:hypothetical protein